MRTTQRQIWIGRLRFKRPSARVFAVCWFGALGAWTLGFGVDLIFNKVVLEVVLISGIINVLLGRADSELEL